LNYIEHSSPKDHHGSKLAPPIIKSVNTFIKPIIYIYKYIYHTYIYIYVYTNIFFHTIQTHQTLPKPDTRETTGTTPTETNEKLQRDARRRELAVQILSEVEDHCQGDWDGTSGDCDIL